MHIPLLGPLIYPNLARFQRVLGDDLCDAVNDIERFPPTIKDIAVTWLATGPYEYFTRVFIGFSNWNAPFREAFSLKPATKAHHCFYESQAYFARHLLQLMESDADYQRYPKNLLLKCIVEELKYGSKIIERAVEYKARIDNISYPEEFAMVFVQAIFSEQYPDKSSLEKKQFQLQHNSLSMLGLMAYTSEMIMRCKDIGRLSII